MQQNEDADIDADKYIALNDWVVAMQNIIPLIKNQIIPEQRYIASTIESAFFLVTRRPYLRGEETTLNWVKVKAKIVEFDVVIQNSVKVWRAFNKVVNLIEYGCWR